MRINEVFLGFNMFKRLFNLVFSFLFLTQAFSQDKEPLPRFSIRAAFTNPIVVSSQAYRKSFKGLVDGGLTLNLRLFGNFGIGIGYKAAMFEGDDFFKKDNFLKTQEQVHDGVFRMGFDYPTGPKSFITLSLNSGFGFHKYTSVKAARDSLDGKYPTEYTAGFIRPEFSANFLVEDNFAFGIFLSYNMVLNTFDPRLPCFDTYIPYSQYRNKAYPGWISFGFGFYYGAKKKKA